MIFLFLAGCSLFGSDAELLYEAESQALALQERAAELSASGQFELSLSKLNEALALDSQSPELWLSQAISLSETGDISGAVQSATRAIALGDLKSPTTGVALYNRACWRLALGETIMASQDLMAAVATGTIDPLQAVADPDLRSLASFTEFDGLISFDLPVELEIDSESYFVGSRWEVSFKVESSYGETPSIGSIFSSAPVSLVEIVDNVIDLGAHESHELTYRFVVDGVMDGELGPFHVESSGLELELPSRPFVFLGPVSQSDQLELREIEFLVPSSLFPEDEDRVVFRDNGRVAVKEVDREEVSWEPSDVVAIHLRSEGQPVWSGYDASLTGVPSSEQTVVITSGSQEYEYSR